MFFNAMKNTSELLCIKRCELINLKTNKFMKISKSLPQFERFPALFITSGEYEAHFYLAFKGEVNEKNVIKMAPRDEAKEKQAFTGHKAGMMDLTSVSHHGNYIEDLKMRFVRNVHGVIHDLLADYKLEEIYIFAPKYVTRRILDGLDKAEQKKVRMQFYKEYTKYSPINLIETFQKEIETIQKLATQTPGNREDLITLLK